MSDFPTPQRVTIAARRGNLGTEIPEITLSVHGAGDGPAVVLCHGFPELAYSWRHQIPPLADAGFRVLVPDQRGYGGSDAPEGVESYDLEHLTSDLAGLLDALGIEKAVFAGHDWGGFVAWAMPLLHPERTAGVIGVNTPYVPFPGTAMLRQNFPDPEKLYILWFQQPDVPEKVLDPNTRAVFEKLMRRGQKPEVTSMTQLDDANPFRRLDQIEVTSPALLTREDVDVYARGYARNGFRGPVSWYRNVDRNAERHPEVGTKKLDLPCLMVTAAWDAALPPAMAAGMPALCSDLETHNIDACGHWTQQEKPEELNRILVDWLRRRFGS